MGRTRVQPTDVRFVCGLSGYFHKDLAAVKSSSHFDPLAIDTAPVTPGFTRVVQPGQVISMLLRLPNGAVAVGDCVDVIFSGAASRDPLFLPAEHLPLLHAVVKPWLLRRDVSVFRANAIAVEALSDGGVKLHTAVRYGLTQALLAGTALVWHCTVAEVVAREWMVEMSARPMDILASRHRNDWLQLDRMIMKQVALLPHASFVHVRDIGPEGKYLLEYSPIVAASKAAQIQRLRQLKQRLHARNIAVEIVADEWCNTLEDIRAFTAADAADFLRSKLPDLGSLYNSIEAILYCQSQGMGCCLGGSANETDVSARITAQVALATQPDFLLSKPGIGADEGLIILTNEMLRTLALVDGFGGVLERNCHGVGVGKKVE